MSKLPCDMVVTFYRDGKFVFETDIDNGGRGQSTESLISECNKICETFGTNLDWEIGLVSIREGRHLDKLTEEIEKLSVELEKVLNN